MKVIIQSEGIVKMRGDSLSGKTINILWLISLEIFGILIFFSNFTTYIHFPPILDLDYKVNSKENDYISFKGLS